MIAPLRCGTVALHILRSKMRPRGIVDEGTTPANVCRYPSDSTDPTLPIPTAYTRITATLTGSARVQVKNIRKDASLSAASPHVAASERSVSKRALQCLGDAPVA